MTKDPFPVWASLADDKNHVYFKFRLFLRIYLFQAVRRVSINFNVMDKRVAFKENLHLLRPLTSEEKVSWELI